MKQIDLSAQDATTVVIKDSDQTQYAVFSDIHQDATISVEILREGQRGEQFITPIKVLHLLEAQNKIEHILGNPMKVYRNDGHIKLASIDLSFNGEINLGENDTIDVKLDSLNQGVATALKLVGGRRLADRLYTVKSFTFKSGEREKMIDLTAGNFLILDKTTLPYEIEFMYGTQKIVMPTNYVLQEQEDVFGVVAYDATNQPIFGTDNVVVLNLKGATSVYLKANSELKNDVKYFMV